MVAREVALGLLAAAGANGRGGAAFVTHHRPGLARDGQQRVIIAKRFFADDDDEGGVKTDPGKASPEKGGGDFPAWVKALTRWDQSDVVDEEQPTPNDVDAKKERTSFTSLPFLANNRRSGWEEEMGAEVASLSGMINVEALVAAAANETDDDVEIMLPGIDSLRKTMDEEGSQSQFNWNLLGGKNDTAAASGGKLFPFLDNELLRWDEFVPLLRKNVQEIAELVPEDGGMNVTFEELVNLVPDATIDANGEVESVAAFNTAAATEKILQDASQRLEFLFNGTSSAFSPSALQSLIVRASDALALQQASGNLTAAAYDIFQQAGRAPRATAQYTAELVQFANGVLAGGYAPLFGNYPSVRSIPAEEQMRKAVKPSEFARLAGAVYEDNVARTHEAGHSIVAQGKTADVGWLVTDSIQYEDDFRSDASNKERKPTLVRTFVLRGYDASDDEVDREGLLNVVCTASPVPILQNGKAEVRVHEGMLALAQELLAELGQYVDLTSPGHKFVFTGHSIGGSLAVLVMILLANDRGESFVKENVLRVYSWGSPPIFEIESTSNLKQMAQLEGSDTCSVLDAFGLPTDIVFGYCQPWDPIVRLFSQYDPLYPLIDDLGEDGYTPWVSGPTRTLRPILKTILESWEGWPAYRDNARVKLGQNYRSIGEQHMLLPEPSRYLTDRLVSVNTAVPPVDSIVQISSRELLPALDEVFKLDVFRISYVSVAVRSFVHHFYPAYGAPVADCAEKVLEED
ncbi:hypothetical protein ACHAXT_007076 [Thalassiosira profunda]